MTADAPPPPRRSLATWVKLLAVWTIGLLIWAGYLAVILFVLVKVLS